MIEVLDLLLKFLLRSTDDSDLCGYQRNVPRETTVPVKRDAVGCIPWSIPKESLSISPATQDPPNG